jgi:hypothetical protein
VPVKSRFGAFARPGATIRQRSSTIAFRLAAFESSGLAIARGLVPIGRGCLAGDA